MATLPNVRCHLFVVTFGRTGSTLLQGILNSLPACTIYGENEGFLMHLFEAFEGLSAAHNRLKNPKFDTSKNPWFGSSRYTEKALLSEFREFADRILFSKRPSLSKDQAEIVGFKEIRHIFIGTKDLTKYLEFLLKLYPDARFIFHSREVTAVLASGWWKKNDPVHTRRQIASFESTAADFTASHPEVSICTTYDQLLSDRETWSEICRFLNVEYDEGVFEATVALNHSYDNRELSSLLAGQNPHVSLLHKQWWRKWIDEFKISIERSGEAIAIKGFLLVRGDTEEEPVGFLLNDAEVPIAIHLDSPAFAVDFPFNSKSATCAFEILLPAESEGLGALVVGGMRVAEISVNI